MTTHTAPSPRSGPDGESAQPPEIATAEAPPHVPAPAERAVKSRSRRLLPRYTWAGTVGALLLGASSFTPSLLPRGWLLQGLIAGIDAAIGYGLGAAVAWFVGAFTRRRPSPTARRRAWQVLAVAGAVLVLLALWFGERWQARIHELMGLQTPPAYQAVGTVVVAVLVFVGLVALGRLLRRLTRWLMRLLGRFLPRRLVRPLAVLVVGVLTVFVLNGVLFQGLVNLANDAFSVRDGSTDSGVVQPSAAERSGSPASLIAWDTLGRQGRNFVGKGPTPEELRAFSGRRAQEPVRIYAGLASAGDVAARAELAVRDLERAGGFDRAVLVVATTTGTGWVDPAAVDSLEYEFNGDTAVVGMQYSYLPSWLSFLVDQTKARDAGRALFDQVYAAWSKLPADHRPKLDVFGESLGSFGGEAAFSGLADIENRTDGVVWAGPPNFNDLWRGFVADREPTSPEWLPVYQAGQTVRFADEPPDLNQPPGSWNSPRVAYLQNASDPIVWWSPRLIFSHPDWLRGQRGPDVYPGMVWLPFVTFWQVTADLAFSTGVPAGHGHHYVADYVDAWAQVAQPAGWTAADTEHLRTVIGAP